MAEPIFFDVLPKFGFSAMEAGLAKFKSAASDSGKTIGASLTNGTDEALKKIQLEYTNAANSATEAARQVERSNQQIAISAQRAAEVTAKYSETSSQAMKAALAESDARYKNAAAIKAEADASATAIAAKAKLVEATDGASASALALNRALNVGGAVAFAGFTAAVYESAKAAGDFQQTQTRLVASAGETQQGMKVVSDGILKLAGDVGYSAQELSKGMYIVESAGFHGADGLKIMTAAAQGAKAENADLTAVNNGLTTSLTDFHLGPEKAAEVMSKMVTAVGESKVTFQEFAGALHSVEPAAAAAHISLEDVYGTLARMTASGMSADQATENMRNAINSLAAPTAQQTAAMAQFGVNADDVSQKLGTRGLSGTMQFLSDAIAKRFVDGTNVSVSALNENAQAAQTAADMMKQMTPAAAAVAQSFANGTMSRKEFTAAVKGSNATDAAQLQQFGQLELKLDGFSKQTKNGRELLETYMNALKQVTGTVAGQSVALQVAGENAGKASDAIQKITDTTVDADGKVKGFNETQSTLNAKMADAKAAFGAAAIELGDVFIPTLTNVAEGLANVGKFLAEHKQIVSEVTIVVGALGTAWLAVKVAMAIGDTAKAVVSGLGWIATNVKLTSASYDGLAISANAAAAAEERAANVPGPGPHPGPGTGAASKVGWGAAAISAAGEVIIPTAAGNAVANDIQGTDHPWYWSIQQGLGAPGRIWHGLTHGGDLGDDSNSPGGLPTAAPGQDAGAANPDRRAGVPKSAPDFTPPVTPQDAAQAAAAVDPNARPDITAPGSVDSAGNGAAKDTATSANIDTTLPFHPLDLNPADTPLGDTYDQWISKQKAVQSAMDSVDTANLDLAKANSHLAELVKKGTATQSEMNNAQEAVSKAQLAQQKSTQDLTIAQTKEAETSKQRSGTGSKQPGTGPTGTSILTSPMEFTPKGVAQYFTALLIDLAVGNPVGKKLAAERGTDPSNPLYTSDVGPGGANGNPLVNRLLPGGGSGQPGGSGSYPGDAALLANVPAGWYSKDAGRDLLKGLSDCSSSVGDLVNIMDGQKTGTGGNLTTANAAEWLPQHGFIPGEGGPGDFRVGYNGGHMQATLPGGTPWNWGSDAAAANRGIGGTGADDPAFTSHFYRPGNGAAGLPTNGGASSSGAIPVFVVNMSGAMSGGSPGAGQGAADGSGAGAPSSGTPGANWDAMAQKEAGGDWAKNSGNGFSGGLQFTPSTWATNKPAGAPDQAWQATKDQQIAAAENVLKTQGPGAWPKTFTPATPALNSPENTNPALNNPLGDPRDLFTGGGGEGPIFKKSPAHGGAADVSGQRVLDRGTGLTRGPNEVGYSLGHPAPRGVPTTADRTFGGVGLPAGTPGTQRPGGFNPYSILSGSGSAIGTHAGGANPFGGPGSTTPSPGGQLGATGGRPSEGGTGKGFTSTLGSKAAAAAAPALDVLAPGTGELAQKGGQLLDRAIGYAGQLAGIGISGLFETFGLNDSPLADPQKSIIGRLAGGFAGAHKTGDNVAGQSQPPLKPPDDQAPPGTPASGNGSGPAPGPGGKGGAPLIGTMNVNHTGDPNGQRIAGDIDRHLSSAGVGRTR